MDPVDTIEYKGHMIKIYQDEDASNPRREFDNMGTMVCWHSRYDLGDKHEFEKPTSWLYSLIEDSKTAQSWNEGEIDDRTFMAEGMEVAQKTHLIMPLFLFDHSGITISTSSASFRMQDSAGWDWGQVGYIYMSHDKIREEYGKRLTKKSLAKAEKYLEGEVKTYDDYLTGQIYGYVVEDDEVGNDDPEIGSCWGFYGYDHEHSGLMEYARNEIDCHFEQTHSDEAIEKRSSIEAVLF